MPHQPKEFARNSWNRLKKDHNLALVENSKVSCIETALKGTVTKLWGGHTLIYSVCPPHLLQLPPEVAWIDLI